MPRAASEALEGCVEMWVQQVSIQLVANGFGVDDLNNVHILCQWLDEPDRYTDAEKLLGFTSIGHEHR